MTCREHMHATGLSVYSRTSRLNSPRPMLSAMAANQYDWNNLRADGIDSFGLMLAILIAIFVLGLAAGFLMGWLLV
jgi:hypothetical protein